MPVKSMSMTPSSMHTQNEAIDNATLFEGLVDLEMEVKGWLFEFVVLSKFRMRGFFHVRSRDGRR